MKRMYTRDFMLMVLGQIISILGSAVLRFALNLYVLDLTGRADLFALVLAASAIPGILFSPVGGALADRVNRRNLMVIFDFSSSAIVLVLAVLLAGGNAPVPVVGVVLALLAVISGAYQPAVQASIPVLVRDDQLASANGIVSGVGAVSGLAGPVLGGMLYSFVGINALVAASCVAFFLSAVMEIFIRIPFTRPERREAIIPTFIADMKQGLRFVAKDKPLIFKAILLAAALNLLVSPFFVVGVPYVLRFTMGSGDILYGIGMGIAELSAILGALTIGFFAKRMRMSTLYRWLLIVSALLLLMAAAVVPPLLSLGFWPSYIAFLLPGAGVVMLMTIFSIFIITVVQQETPNEMLGKVMAIIMAVAQCAAPFGQLLYGGLFEAFSAAVYIPVLLSFAFTVLIALAARTALREGPGTARNTSESIG